MELTNSINLNLEKNNRRENFLNSTLWRTINNGIDIGLRYLLPDLVEDEIIELKDNLINLGLKDGIKKSVENVVETGKQAIGILSGNFEDIGQVQRVIKNGGIIDKISDVFDTIIEKGENSGKINSSFSYILKNGKSSILNSVERNIEATLNNQVSKVNLVDKYINNWKEFYNKKDFNGMEKEYKKIESSLKELVPLENTLKNARQIETLHELIRNNGQNFNLSEEEIELAGKLNWKIKTDWKRYNEKKKYILNNNYISNCNLCYRKRERKDEIIGKLKGKNEVINGLTNLKEKYILSIYFSKEGKDMITKIQKWGNSKGVRIPKAILESLEWKENEPLTIDIKDGKIIIEKQNERKSIKELFKDYNDVYEPEKIEWGEPTGEEIW